MGNVVNRPETNNIYQPYSAPFLKTPISDYFVNVLNYQFRKDCGMYEIHYVDCLEAYGERKGEEKCKLIYLDLQECLYQRKRLRRTAMMRTERHRQYKNGEREKEYSDTSPPLDLY